MKAMVTKGENKYKKSSLMDESVEQSRRDDLESLGYVLAYFLRGLLPWQGVNATSQAQKYQRIGKIKRTTSIADLCAGFPGKQRIVCFLSNYGKRLQA